MRAERVQATKQSHTSGRRGTGAPTKPSARIARWTPVLFLVALLVLPAAAAQLDPEDPVHQAKATAYELHDTVMKRAGSPGSLLFFTEEPLDDPDDRWNFTALPPTGGHTQADSRSADLHDSEGFQASWSWYLPTTPMIWNVRPGDQWDLVLYIEGLTADPEGDSDAPHPVYTIEVQALTSQGTHAIGTTETSRFDIGEGPHRYALTAHVDEHHEFYPGKSDPQVEIQITISAKEEVDPPVALHYGSLEHPSRLMLPRYPHDALTEMRASESTGVEPAIQAPCVQTIDESCALEEDDEDDGDDGSSPQNSPQGPSGSESASTVTTGQSTESSELQEEAPEDESPQKEAGPDAVSTASTSGVIVLLAWTLFVASAGSYGRSDRSKQTQDIPRVVGRPKQTGADEERTAQNRAHARKDARKDQTRYP